MRLFLRLWTFGAFFVSKYVGLLRTGSSRKRFSSNNTTNLKVWERGQRRIWLNSIVYIISRFKDQTQRKGQPFAFQRSQKRNTSRDVIFDRSLLVQSTFCSFLNITDNICSCYFVGCIAQSSNPACRICCRSN